MGDDAPKLPPAFKLCKDCSCDAVKEEEYREGEPPPEGKKDDRPVIKEVGCTKSEKCSKGGCYCQLFERRKGEKHKDDTWRTVPTNRKGFARPRGDRDYSCFCVEPVLPAEYTLHACGECSLENVGEGSLKFVKCSGKCPSGAECHLFCIRLPHGEWKHEADPEKLMKPDDDFYYRCFCVKKG